MELSLYVKTVFGTPKIYPRCEQSAIFCQMLNQKTLTYCDLNYIGALGYTFKVGGDTESLEAAEKKVLGV